MMTTTDARKRHTMTSPDIAVAEAWADLTSEQQHYAAAMLVSWYVEHAEADRARVLTIFAEAVAVTS